jgi:membrane protein implicated in regulation of membrane protease activity
MLSCVPLGINADVALWGFLAFLVLAVVSLVSGWLLHRALVKADREKKEQEQKP